MFQNVQNDKVPFFTCDFLFETNKESILNLIDLFYTVSIANTGLSDFSFTLNHL